MISRFIFQPKLLIPKFNFSQFFRKKDENDLSEYTVRHAYNKMYRSVIAKWKKPLQKKQLRRIRLNEVKLTFKKKQPQTQKLVVHNPALGIEFPPKEKEMFCIVKVDDRQYKVMKDTMLLLDTKSEHQINKKIIFNEVLLLGTKTYTLIGRPNLNNTQVEGIVQSISKSDKVIVFKKKRRKQYKKSFGSRVSLSSVKIININHQINQNAIATAVKLE